ncbi:MAG: type II toxin-antitoxin system prevent-host-death family antitoxin [Kiritimatiellae bacterium]|nr:type II toxin-antitoxin system prevent-host-death family antitoxin [Kiritimatiellia bacterium]
MRSVNVAEMKTHFSNYLKMVMNGEPVEVCKRNVAVARIVPVVLKRINKTRLGCGKGSVKINGDITEPAISAFSWNMLEGEDS